MEFTTFERLIDVLLMPREEVLEEEEMVLGVSASEEERQRRGPSRGRWGRRRGPGPKRGGRRR